MQVGILITAAATEAAASRCMERISALLASPGRTLYRIFIYGDAVQMAKASGNDEHSPWQRFADNYAGLISVCAAAAHRRGVITDDNRTLAQGFSLAGLGDWVDMVAHCDQIEHLK